MRTIGQIAELTGISTRTLQYYDEIGLLKPSALTQAGYRSYDDEALRELQQILFFKELGFPLKEIREILQRPDFDRMAAFRKQKELLLLKRDRLERLIALLSRLEKGEPCMSLKEFDLSEYLNALEDFKSKRTEEVVRYWGSVENFDLFLRKIREDEEQLAKLAIRQFGSVEAYTEAMKRNLDHFSELMEERLSQIPEEVWTEDKFLKLASHRGEGAASESVQSLVREIIAHARENAPSELAGLVEKDDDYCRTILEVYSNDYLKTVTDAKYGAGSCDFIVEAFRRYVESQRPKGT